MYILVKDTNIFNPALIIIINGVIEPESFNSLQFPFAVACEDVKLGLSSM